MRALVRSRIKATVAIFAAVWLCMGTATAGEIAKDIAVLSLGAAADEVSTAYALRACASCREAGYPTAYRMAGKAAVIGISVAGAHEMRKRGHKGWAQVLRWAPTAIWGGAAINNMLRAKGAK